MATLQAVLTSPKRDSVEFQHNIDSQSTKSHLRQLQDGLVKVQKDLNDKLTEYVNEDKAVNGSFGGASRGGDDESEGRCYQWEEGSPVSRLAQDDAEGDAWGVGGGADSAIDRSFLDDHRQRTSFKVCVASR